MFSSIIDCSIVRELTLKHHQSPDGAFETQTKWNHVEHGICENVTWPAKMSQILFPQIQGRPT